MPRMLGHFRRVPVCEKAVGAKGFVDFHEVKFALGFLCGAGDASDLRCQQACVPAFSSDSIRRQRPRIFGGRVAAGIAHQPRVG